MDPLRQAQRTHGLVVAIDGRSGSGKTTLAQEWAQQWRADGLQVEVVGLDLVYPGWSGLAQGVERAAAALREWAARGQSRLPQWDWVADAPAPDRVLGPCDVLVVEGVGAAQVCADLADHVIVLGGSPQWRRAQAAQRERDLSWWEPWAAQEERLFARHPLPDPADVWEGLGEPPLPQPQGARN